MHIEKMSDLTADEISSVSVLTFNLLLCFCIFFRFGGNSIKTKMPFVPLFQLARLPISLYTTSVTFFLVLSLSLPPSLNSLINMSNS